MPCCAVFLCKNRSNTSSLQKDGITFHLFPRNVATKQKWVEASNRPENWTPTRTSCICSRHFEPSQFIDLANKRRKLIKDAIPTLYLPKQSYAVAMQVNVKFDQSAPSTSTNEHSQNENITYHEKKIKQINGKTGHVKNNVTSLEDLLKNLDEKSLIDKDQKLILQKIGVQNDELIKSSDTGKITREALSPELRCFALTLHCYSPKAYRYARKTFATSLPHPRTTTKWYANVNGRPGFTNEALNALKLLKEANPDKNIYCTLVLDKMKIKESSNWDRQSQRHYGHVDLGFDYADDGTTIATDALMFLLVGINTTWQMPIGYFLIKEVSATLKAQLVTTALRLVHKTGVQIKALTCDGTNTNISMAEELGCNMDPNNLSTTLEDPSTGQNIHFFLDPCHMLKLIRNSFEFYKYFRDSSGNCINWSNITNLHKLQEEELNHLTNKLRLKYHHFKTKIMHVHLSTQLFSKSVADALTFCKTQLKLSDYQDASATADFLKVINDMFHILNSKTGGIGFKKPMCRGNHKKCYDRLDEGKFLIMHLYADVRNRKNEVERVNILESPRHTGFLGLLVCINSAKALFDDLVLNTETRLSCLPFYKISRDHFETVFSNIRSHSVYSDNPTAREFESIYEKLFIEKEIIINKARTICTPLENISIMDCSDQSV